MLNNDEARQFYLGASYYEIFLEIKIILSILRISIISMLFVKYFLEYEFNITLQPNCIYRLLILRFFSNFIIILVNFVPYVFFFYYSKLTCIFIFALKFVRFFLDELLFVYFGKFIRRENLELNFISLFWCFVLSALRAFVFIEEFEPFRLAKFRKSSFLRNLLMKALETILMLGFMFQCLPLLGLVALLIVISICVAQSFFLEICLWNFEDFSSIQIRREFRKWILLQNSKIKLNQKYETSCLVD